MEIRDAKLGERVKSVPAATSVRTGWVQRLCQKAYSDPPTLFNCLKAAIRQDASDVLSCN